MSQHDPWPGQARQRRLRAGLLAYAIADGVSKLPLMSLSSESVSVGVPSMKARAQLARRPSGSGMARLEQRAEIDPFILGIGKRISVRARVDPEQVPSPWPTAHGETARDAEFGPRLGKAGGDDDIAEHALRPVEIVAGRHRNAHAKLANEARLMSWSLSTSPAAYGLPICSEASSP
jgi:hypothetical protein